MAFHRGRAALGMNLSRNPLEFPSKRPFLSSRRVCNSHGGPTFRATTRAMRAMGRFRRPTAPERAESAP